MTHRESLTQIGLRAEKNVAKHLLGRMVGRAASWPTFRKWTIWKATKARQNCNVYGHLPKEEVVSVPKRLLCTSGEDGSAKRIVSGVSNLVRETVGGACKTPSLLELSQTWPCDIFLFNNNKCTRGRPMMRNFPPWDACTQAEKCTGRERKRFHDWIINKFNSGPTNITYIKGRCC